MDYRNSWNLWVHPVWNAFLSNPAYYYYCNAKAALQNQHTMVRKTGNPPSSRQPQPQSQGPTNAVVPVGIVGAGGNGINSVLKLYGVEECPECKSRLDLTDNRPLKEFCGHIRCRRCLLKATPCVQCKQAQLKSSPPRKVANGIHNGSTVSPAAALPSQKLNESAPARTYPPHVRSYGTSRNQRGGGEGGGIGRYNHNTSRFLNGSDRKSNGISPQPQPEFGLVGKRTSRPLDIVRAVPSTSAELSPCSVEAVKVLKSFPSGQQQQHSVKTIPIVQATILENKSVGRYVNGPDLGIPPLPATSTTDKICSAITSSSSLPPSASTTHLNIGKSSACTKERSPTPSFEAPMNSHHPDSSGSDEPSSSSSDLKDRRKKKRHPVVIHDHITVISGEPTMFQCNVCMKKFKTKAHIKYHEFCQNGEKPFKCEQCGQGFIAKSHYEYHLRTHTGERPYVCPKCGKGFNQRGKVTRHMRSHTGEKPFVCDECGRGFANAQALRSHHLIHTGERPFACKYCNKRFTGMTNLKKHIITHTGERPYVCTHCGKSFGLKWTLDLHLRTHSSERPYACEQCTRAFSNSKDLRRHLVIHSGERPFKCWICGTAFRRKDNLDRHIKNTHNQPKEVAKQLANEAAAEYLAINANSPVPASKVNSAVISNVIRAAQLNGPTGTGSGTTAPKTRKEKERLKTVSGKKKKKLINKIVKKPTPVVLDVVVASNKNESSTTNEATANEVLITAELSPREDSARIEQVSNILSEAKIEQDCNTTSEVQPEEECNALSEAKLEQESNSPPANDYFIDQCSPATAPATPEEMPAKDTIEKESVQDAVMTTTIVVLSTQHSPQCVNEEKIESETFDNYILPDTEESYLLGRFTSVVEVEEKFHPQSSSGSFMGFDSQCEAEQKLRHESPHGADGLSDFSKSRNLTPSDCGIRLFDKVGSSIPPDTAQLDLTSIISHASGDEDTEHVFVDEKETQTIFEEFNESNLDMIHDCKILVGRPRSIFPEGEYEDGERSEKESSCLRDKETNPKDEDMEREDFTCSIRVEETTTTLEIPVKAEDGLMANVDEIVPVSQPSPKSDEVPASTEEAGLTEKPTSENYEPISSPEKPELDATILAQTSNELDEGSGPLEPDSGSEDAEISMEISNASGKEETTTEPLPTQMEKSSDIIADLAEEETATTQILPTQMEKPSEIISDETATTELPPTQMEISSEIIANVAEEERATTETLSTQMEKSSEIISDLAEEETATTEILPTQTEKSSNLEKPEFGESILTPTTNEFDEGSGPVEPASRSEDAEINMGISNAAEEETTTEPPPTQMEKSIDIISNVEEETTTTELPSTQIEVSPDINVDAAEEETAATEPELPPTQTAEKSSDIISDLDEPPSTVSAEPTPAASPRPSSPQSGICTESNQSNGEEKDDEVEAVTPTEIPTPMSPRFNHQENPEEPCIEDGSQIGVDHPHSPPNNQQENSQMNMLFATTAQEEKNCLIGVEETTTTSEGPALPSEAEDGLMTNANEIDGNEIVPVSQLSLKSDESPSGTGEVGLTEKPTSGDSEPTFSPEKPEFDAMILETTTIKIEEGPGPLEPVTTEEVGLTEKPAIENFETSFEKPELDATILASTTIKIEEGPGPLEPATRTDDTESSTEISKLAEEETATPEILQAEKSSDITLPTGLDQPPSTILSDPTPAASPRPSSPENGICTESNRDEKHNATVPPPTEIPTEMIPRFYHQENPDQPYTGDGYFSSQIGIEHPYSPHPNPNQQEPRQNQAMNILYATATAMAERNYDESGPPLKIRLLHAEAFGVQNSGDDIPDRRVFYTSTRPNQVIDDYSSPTIALSSPAIIHPPEDRGSSPLVTIHQYRYEQEAPPPAPRGMGCQYPVQVSYQNNGVVHAQTMMSDHPDRSSLINRAREASRDLADADYYSHREWNGHDSFATPVYNLHQNVNHHHQSQNLQHLQPQQISYSSHPQSSQMGPNYYGILNDPQAQDMINYHTSPEQQQHQQQSSPQDYKFYNPLRELAAEATRRLCQRGPEEYNATIAAAAAIAAVGEEARKQREEELKNRLLIEERVRICELQRRENRRRSAASRKTYY